MAKLAPQQLQELRSYLGGSDFAPGLLELQYRDACQAYSLEALREANAAAAKGRRTTVKTESDAAGQAPTLGCLIAYLESEVEEKKLGQRCLLRDEELEEALVRKNMKGREAVVAYMAELVHYLREFPYTTLDEDCSVGAWIRDDVVATAFKGWWDFYENRPLDEQPLSIKDVMKILCGEGMLLERLRFARLAARLP
eukprot:TRINITY_DN82571_c0_g1_i1.p1 TRINITY_DN82571_c0_g1~~TRINITY_DN82571_c0_g1_i1.p1  ORF type:complete len:197 (-),score=46.66 TRINITY_DN82571_c0_g1_i1:272-862(-)